MSRVRWLTVPNAVTLVRLALIAPIVALLVTGAEPVVAALLATVFGATDWVDGWLARRLDQVSRVGAVLDPVADRLGIGCVAIALAIAGAAPWWTIAVFPAVDLVVVAACAARRRPLSVSRVGKVRTGVAMVGILAVMVGMAPGLDRVLWIGRAVLAVAALLHIAAGIGYLRQSFERTPRAGRAAVLSGRLG